ncbi:unnamed protein product [Rotaria sordida]|uniref:G-protein coupled receptors family 1 profile domain-containing protein n=1 Tax=Rotaria sordida TaxID=392033 RepID=A0A819EWZ6_9BILA|nr:unnamed protein product [Rotaria sordida]CAF3856384.1 unnamed protein product [Rotaria sordida]
MESPLAQKIGLYGYIFTFPLGFIGHILSLVTFSSQTLRVTSTGFLFICLTLSDIIYQLMSINDFIIQVLRVPTSKSVYLCRLRTFILNFLTFTSAWILVLISMDRLIRVRFPHKQRQLCTPKLAALFVSITCICSIIFTCHVLQSDFGFSDPVSPLCGPSRFALTFYSKFYFNIWPILQLFITYFIPNCLMIVSVICIRISMNGQQIQFIRSRRREKNEQQMFILMASSIICFAICTLSYSIHRIVYQRFGVNLTTLIEIAILTVFLNINYCYNFYIHCLTSKFFREKFIEQFERIFCGRKRQIINTSVHPLSLMTKPRN